jgi:glycosyltransferase involved in cell wall biosynthesis
MKFSVLLPTRNRLKYLMEAVETVRRQDYDDWEIIISDNFSEEDVQGYVDSLNEPRIKYFRTERFVPVTENWNNAHERSSGDYVIMLGDDDGLLPGYFRSTLLLIEEFDHPDLIYTGAYLLAYPGATTSHPGGSVHTYSYAVFLQEKKEPYLLDPAEAAGLARQALKFQAPYGYNMQFALVARKFIDSLAGKGRFYQSPFPDYYAMNVMFLKAKRILVCPEPLVAIGISPKSYGSYLDKKVESEGVKFLEARSELECSPRLRDVVLPGTNMNTSWLHSVEAIRENYGSEFHLKVDYNRYRYIQIATTYRRYYLDGDVPKSEMNLLKKEMRVWERLIYGCSFDALGIALPVVESNRVARATWLAIFRGRDPRRIFWSIWYKLKQHPHGFTPSHIDIKCSGMIEFFEMLEAGAVPGFRPQRLV